MRRAGTESWRFAEDLGQLPHAILYIRDALGLGDTVPGSPPRLTGEVPDRGELLNASDRREAARRWTAWWAAVMDIDSRVHLGANPAGRESLGDMAAPASSPALTDAGGLRSAAVDLFPEACRWADGVLRPERPPVRPGAGRFSWHLTRDIAEQVTAETGVGAGAINGAVSIVLVEGVWWERVAPQFAICSAAAADDPEIAESIVRDVFSSGLGNT